MNENLADRLYLAGYEDRRLEENCDPRRHEEWQKVVDQMQEPTAHPFAPLLIALAKGKSASVRLGAGNWFRLADARGSILRCLVRGDNEDDGELLEFKIEEPKIRVNGTEVPRPLTEAPSNETKVFWPSLADRNLHDSFLWNDHIAWHLTLLERRLLHLTAGAAIEHATAMLQSQKA